MAQITSNAVYDALLDAVREAVADEMPSASVYLSDRAVPDTAVDRCIQIITNGPEAMFPRSGTGGVKETFEIHFWKRVVVDDRIKINAALSSAKESVTKTMMTVRRKMVLENLGDRLHVGMVFIRSSRPKADAAGGGWVNMFDTYEARYELQSG